MRSWIAGTIAATVFLNLVGCSEAASAQPEAKSPYALIDAYVAAELKADRVPGGALVITQAGGVVHSQGFGTDGKALSEQCTSQK